MGKTLIHIILLSENYTRNQKLKNATKVLVGQAVLELLIKNKF